MPNNKTPEELLKEVYALYPAYKLLIKRAIHINNYSPEKEISILTGLKNLEAKTWTIADFIAYFPQRV